MHEFRFFNQRHALINPDNFLAGSEGSKRTILYRRHFSDFKAGKISAEKLARIKSDLRNPSRVTRIVFNISRQNFGLHGAPTKEFVQGILDWMNKNISYVGERVGSKSIGLMHLMYGKLSAEDILVKRKIPTVFNEMGDPLFGCGEACDAFIALLKTFRGIDRIRHVRVTVPSFDPETRKLGLTAHSVVMFQIAKKAFLADPFNKGVTT